MTDVSFRSIIELWPTRAELASDVGTTAWNVSKWWQSDSIPAPWWSHLLATRRARDAGITAVMMTALAARSREPVEARSA